jgi:hypothetical protein
MLLIALTSLLGCSGSGQLDRLRGTWVSEPFESEWGHVRVRLEFTADERLRVGLLPPESTEKALIDQDSYEAPYKVRWGRLNSEALNKNRPVKFSIEDGVLILKTETEPPMRLRRE